MFPSDKTSQLRPLRLGSYLRIVQSRKPRVKNRSRKSDAQSPYQLEKRLKKIFVTREVYTRSEHSPETPPRKFLGGFRLNRSATRLRASAANIPSPPPPSSRASTIQQPPTVATMDGLQFREDPRFRPWHRSLLAGGGRDNASIGAFENDIGAQDRVPPYEAVSQELEPILDNTDSFADGSPPAPLEIHRSSADSYSDDYKRLSCVPLQLQTAGIGRSASLLKARIARKVWLGKSLRARLHSSRPEDLAQIQEPGRIAIPRRITIGRGLRSQKKSENLRVSSGVEEEGTQSHATLRLVNADVEQPQSNCASRDPELTAMLHDPNQNRFSDSWEKFYEEQTQGIVEKDKQLLAATVLQSTVASSLKASPPSAANRFLASGTAVIATHEGHLQGLAAGLIETQMRVAPPTIKITESRGEPPGLIAPSPGPRTSSKGGIFAKFMGPGKVPPPVSPSIIRSRPSNISKPRKASESSILTDYENSMHPVHSTDTLTKIEVELQSSPSRPALANIANLSTRTKNLSIDSGPSGSAPDRELPQLPEDAASEKSRSRGSSRNGHVRKQSSISIGHARNNLSTSSISTVRAISPSKHGSAGSHTLDHAWIINSDASQRVVYRQGFNQVPFDHSATARSEALRPAAYSPDYSLPASTEAFLRKQAQKAARAESRRVIKQRDMASNGIIEEEHESDTGHDMVSPLTQPVDPIDQFPDPPCSRSGSRASTRRARSTQRSHSAARRVPHRGIANQTLSASRIVTIEDVGPATPHRRNNHRSPSTKSCPSDSPLRDGAGTPIRQKVKSSLPKKPSQRSIRSHTSQSALAPNGAHTPPSSDSCASDDELALGGLHRLNLRREIQEIRALMILQGRTIDKLQNTVRLYMPTGRNRSRDLSLDRQRQLQQQLQLAPPSFCYPRRPIGGTEPGPVMIGDVVVDAVDGGRGFMGGGMELEERRLSTAPLTVRMDSMVDQQFRRLG